MLIIDQCSVVCKKKSRTLWIEIYPGQTYQRRSAFLIFPVKQGDECGSLAEFNALALAMQYSFSNFSFKVNSTTQILLMRLEKSWILVENE